jgi:hypothetical protein
LKKKKKKHSWKLAPVRKITVRSQPGQIVRETLSQKTHHKKKAGGVAQGVGLSSNHSTAKKERKEKNVCGM